MLLGGHVLCVISLCNAHSFSRVLGMVTFAILWVVTREVFGRVRPGVGDTLPLPLTALFALPAVRTFLPGNPPVGGTLDSFGVIPQIIVLGSCVRLPSSS